MHPYLDKTPSRMRARDREVCQKCVEMCRCAVHVPYSASQGQCAVPLPRPAKQFANNGVDAPYAPYAMRADADPVPRSGPVALMEWLSDRMRQASPMYRASLITSPWKPRRPGAHTVAMHGYALAGLQPRGEAIAVADGCGVGRSALGQ